MKTYGKPTRIIGTMEEDIERLKKPVRTVDKKFLKKLQDHGHCVISGTPTPDTHHLFTVGHRGDDVAWNVVCLAHVYHNELHNSSIDAMADKYPRFLSWLIDNQWYYDDLMKKWRHKTNVPNTSSL